MSRPDTMKQIEQRIATAPAGTAFITSDFLESMDKVDPAYRQEAAKNCCAVLVEHMMKQQHQR